MTSVRQLIAAAGERMQVEFDGITAQTPHRGERGRAREDVLREFLKAYLPGRAGVTNGIIVDHADEQSLQMDVIIHDAHSTPVFRISETVQLLPAETVFLVIQVKSHLGRRQVILAVDNIRSAARLRRSAEPSHALLAGYRLDLLSSDEIKFTHKPASIPGGIFAYRSPRLATVARNLADAMAGRPLAEWPAFVVSLEQGTIMYGRQNEDGSTAMSAGAPGNTMMVMIPADRHHPLLMLYAFAVSRTQLSLSSQPDVLAYLGLGGPHAYETLSLGD